MAARKPGISREANAFIRLQRGVEITIPQRQNIKQYRIDTRMSFKPAVDRALEIFEGCVEETQLGGIACTQISAKNWSAESGPCILYAYGGGMVSGSPYEDLIITSGLAQHLDARVISLNYRLSPEHPYPAPTLDIQAVYRELEQQYGADRLVVSGESAGGNLALGLLVYLRDNNFDMPKCAALFSPWVDLRNQGDSHSFNNERDPTLNQAWVESATDLYAGEQARDDPGVSPLYADLKGLPPTIVTTGSRDLLMSQSLMLAAKLRASGVFCDLRVWEGLWHVFEFYNEIPESALSIEHNADFIRSCFN